MIVCHPIKFTLILKSFEKSMRNKRIMSGRIFKTTASVIYPVGLTTICEQLLAFFVHLRTKLHINKFMNHNYLND